MPRLSSQSFLALAVVVLALPAERAQADGTLSRADLVAESCPSEWAALEAAAPEEVAVYRPLPVDPDWGIDVAAAMGRLILLADVVGANTGALIAVMGVTASDEAWQVAMTEHDLDYEWSRGRARSNLLDCLMEATRAERDLVMNGAFVLLPYLGEERLQEEVENQFAALDNYWCYSEAGRRIFELEVGRADLAAVAREIFENTLAQCDG